MTLHTFLVAAALIFLALASVSVGGAGRINFLALGLLCWFGSTLR